MRDVVQCHKGPLERVSLLPWKEVSQDMLNRVLGGKADVDTNPRALLRTGREAKPGDFGKQKKGQ